MIRVATLVASLCLVAVLGATTNPSPPQALADANDAWARGDYASALAEYLRLLNAPGGDALLDPIALQTGELYRSAELTADGRNPRFSPDGQFIAYETGLEVSRRTTIVRNDDALTPVADLPGVSAAFSPTAPVVAYLKIVDSAELATAVKVLHATPLAASGRGPLVQALAYQVLRQNAIAVRDLASGREQVLPVTDLLKTGLVYGPDGRTLYFLGGVPGETARNDIYAIGEGRPLVRLGDADGVKSAPTAANGFVLFNFTAQNPFRAPQPPGGGQGPAAASRPPSFGVIDLATNTTRIIEGTAPALSANLRAMTYIARAGAEYHLMAGPLGAEARAIKKTTDRIDAPALSPDGTVVAFQAMARDDWEIQTIASDGSSERRLTRDSQPDVLPRFIGPTHLMAVVGEPRHRRSFMYNVTTGERARLFHNNTVRTIAPEYQWTVSQDGTRLLVGAERDGDTVSPERGIYLLRLDQKISRSDLVSRLETSLAAETQLRAASQKAFAPITGIVRKVTDDVSVARIYGYEKALFDFDSKHISRPGNRQAADYLYETYRSFGYTPEYQWFDQRNALGGRTANVIATLQGTVNPELVYVVSSHYDSVAGGPGADDNSSGTAALLEAARVLAKHPMPATIVFASFTGEEAGLLGSREFVRRAVEGKRHIAGALNNDMIGWTNDQRLDNTIRYSNPGIRDIQHGAAMLFSKLITYDALYFKSTDAAAYYDAYGDIVGGIGSYPVLSNPHYHQPHDLLEFVNHQLVAETSKTTVATLMLLASSPARPSGLTLAGRSDTATRITWEVAREKGVASYVVSYSRPGGAAPGRQVVKTPRATLPALPSGATIAVKALDARGLESWDWARITIP